MAETKRWVLWAVLVAASLLLLWSVARLAVHHPAMLLPGMGEAGSALALPVAIVSLVVSRQKLKTGSVPAAVAPVGSARRDLLARLPTFGNPRLDVRRFLRVHEAQALGKSVGVQSLDPDLPLWVSRALASEVGAWLETARKTGGFLILTGDSSVGKTRLLYEVARQELAGWPVLAPPLGHGDPVNEFAEAPFSGRLLVWLDELHRFLPGPEVSSSHGVTAATIAKLLDAPGPVVILGSMWPEQFTELQATHDNKNQTYRHPEAAAALRLADKVLTLHTFNPVETKDARRLGEQDPRLAEAAKNPHYGVTEALAGAPMQMVRYQNATGLQRAILHAAIDARRLGVPPPLKESDLAAAARAYLTSIEADDTWVRPTLDDLTRRDATGGMAGAPLLAISDTDHRRVLGYDVNDFLLQQATRQRRSTPIPAAAWNSLIANAADPDVLKHLAHHAGNRGLHRHAIHAFCRAIDAGDHSSSSYLVHLLAQEQNAGELQARADAGDHWAAEQLAGLLYFQGNVDELRAKADAGDYCAAERLSLLLAELGNVEELRSRAEAGGRWATERLAFLLAELGNLEELRALADAGNPNASKRLVSLLAERGEVEELRARAQAGNSYVVYALKRSRDLGTLQALADAGVVEASRELAFLLVRRGEVEELRARAEAGDREAALWLTVILANPGDLSSLHAAADRNRIEGLLRLWVDLLYQTGEIEALQGWAAAGVFGAEERVIELLAKSGDLGPLRGLAESGNGWAEERLAFVLAEQGKVEELRSMAATGNVWAVKYLTEALSKVGDFDGLRVEVEAGTPLAYDRLRALVARAESSGPAADDSRRRIIGTEPPDPWLM